ncbi:MAG: hypothetical protein RL571_2898 [Pseudomonadota bacterium]|jgi:hypothetical protein
MRKTLSVLSKAGLSVNIKNDGNTLSVIPSKKLTNDLRQLIIQHKADILAEIQAANTPRSGVIRWFSIME